MQQQNVINTTNAITTYCFKFHPPFLSPEVLSVCRLSLSIVNLLAVPLLSAAAIPSSARPKPLRSSGLAGVRPISFSYAYGKRSEKPTVFRTRWRVHMHRIRLPLQASASVSMHAHFCLCVHYTPCREVFQSLFFICR